MIAYVYAADGNGERAEAHLGDFAGILQVDGYGGYAALARRRSQVSLAFCWVHVRRKFYELADHWAVATEVRRRLASSTRSRMKFAANPPNIVRIRQRPRRRAIGAPDWSTVVSSVLEQQLLDAFDAIVGEAEWTCNGFAPVT